jgi:hypothetical protein
VLTQHGCNTAQCHGGGIRGTYQLSSVESPDLQFDFDQSRLQVNPADPIASPLLTKPLSAAAGGILHSYEPFVDTADPGYLAILAWIEEGRFE